MENDDKQPKAVGVYDRPAGADRKRGKWILITLAVLISIAWTAYFAFSG